LQSIVDLSKSKQDNREKARSQTKIKTWFEMKTMHLHDNRWEAKAAAWNL
jgi:hypothetical protein